MLAKGSGATSQIAAEYKLQNEKITSPGLVIIEYYAILPSKIICIQNNNNNNDNMSEP